MKLRILNQYGDTLVDVTEDTLAEAERIIHDHQEKGGAVIGTSGVVVNGKNGGLAGAMERGEAAVYAVPMLMGG